MPPSLNPRQLIVEGHDDKHAILGLVRSHLTWPPLVDDAPVFIQTGGSPKQILSLIPVYLKMSALRTLGIVVDADANAFGRYQSIHDTCKAAFQNMPSTLPAGGLISDGVARKRLGIWIMPDNSSTGALETFLRSLVPNQAGSLWRHAEQSCHDAKNQHDAPFKPNHADKAKIYSWLSWQDEPGQNAGSAIYSKALDANAVNALQFIDWFKRLYDL